MVQITDPEFAQWEQRDAMVIAWIIENINGEMLIHS